MKTHRLVQTQIAEAVEILKKGGLVAFPTETVYGLGALAFDPEGAKKIYRVKGRPADNPLIVHVANLAQCKEVAIDLSPLFYALAARFFPGPLTLIVKKHPNLPKEVCGGLETVALRMPSHHIAQALISAVAEPLIAPSANLSSKPSGTTAEDVLEDFDGVIDAVIDGGATLHGIESTVLDLVNFSAPTLLRPGIITKEELEEFLEEEIFYYTQGPKAAPGMKYRHYAPKAEVTLCKDEQELLNILALRKEKKGVRILSLLPLPALNKHFFIRSLTKETLYRELRLADREGIIEVVIFAPFKTEVALLNRVEKMGASF